MSVHYKFKSTLHFDTITFDGLHISVGDLKREIIQQKRLGKVIDFDLQITNAQTKEEYKEDDFLIPKNTTLIISRIPIAHQAKKGWDPPTDNSFTTASATKQDNFNMDLSKMQGSEEEKIQAMMMQSTADYDPKTYHRIKGQSQVGEVPPSYRCNKCKKGGHWIKNCPFISGKDQFETKRNTGIPRSFRDKPEMSMDHGTTQFPLHIEEKQEIPEDLVCGICRDLFVDAVMIPCCGSSFCDDCVRTSLLESEDSECPDCKEKNCSPGSLIPNRFLRNSVNVFKNETGYKIETFKTANKSNATPPETPQEEESPKLREPNSQDKAEHAEQQDQPQNDETGKDLNVQEMETNESIQKDKEKSDSDYEDNITIKMPSQKLNDNVSAIANISNSKKSPPQLHIGTVQPAVQRRPPDFQYDSEKDSKQHSSTEFDNFKAQNNDRSLLPTPISIHHSYQNQILNEQIEKPLMNVNMSSHAHRLNAYKPAYLQTPRGHPMQMISHHMPQYNNSYNNIPHRPPMGYNPYPNHPINPMRTAYIPPGNANINSSQTFQSTNLASIYQGVAAKVGTGLIDDPLEAFNRIMKEKEKQKVDRRRSPDRRRSRSQNRHRRFKSPVYDRDSSRDSHSKEKRARSRDRKHEFTYDRRLSRGVRHSPKGSNSSNDTKKRSVHRRSPSPKSGYQPKIKEKSLNKLHGSKIETIEPPPPGFESLQIGGTPDNEIQGINTKASAVPSDPKREPSKSEDIENVTRKRQRSCSKTKDNHNEDNYCRSLTPPTKSKNLKVIKGSGDELFKGSPRTPEKKDDVLELRDNSSGKRLWTLDTRHSNMEKQGSEELDANHTGKENELKADLQLKDRKKKKKIKSDRKKNKKDKKEKREKNKKSTSPNHERPSNADDPLQANGTNRITNFSTQSSEIASTNDIDSRGDEKLNKINKSLKTTCENLQLDKLSGVDSILDIQCYDTDFDEGNTSSKRTKKNDGVFHVSKWESEDNYINCNSLHLDKKEDQEYSAITTDVIRKAENAIFAKAINAIRPVEFKVILDSRSSSKDRSTSMRNEVSDRSLSPKCNINKSVKDRLGSKIVCEKVQSPKQSKERRMENARKDLEDKYKNTAENNRSRKRVKTSKEHFKSTERRRDSKDGEKGRQSHEAEVGSQRDRNRETVGTHRYKSQIREKPIPRNNKYETNIHHDYIQQENSKATESRTISSVASRPCRPDNPFRKFDDCTQSSNFNSKLRKGSKHDSSNSVDSNSEDEQAKKKKKYKKFKKHSKCSSPESAKSEKRRDLKGKKKTKLLKKKKKSKK